MTFSALHVRYKNYPNLWPTHADNFAEFNKDEQGQIQAVLANVETVQPGYWWNPFGHSLQVGSQLPESNLPLH